MLRQYGIADWTHFGRNVDRPESSKQYAISYEIYCRWNAEKTIESQPESSPQDFSNNDNVMGVEIKEYFVGFSQIDSQT